MMLPCVSFLLNPALSSLIVILSTDYVLIQDKSFKKYAKAYADDNDLFFKEYGSSFRWNVYLLNHLVH